MRVVTAIKKQTNKERKEKHFFLDGGVHSTHVCEGGKSREGAGEFWVMGRALGGFDTVRFGLMQFGGPRYTTASGEGGPPAELRLYLGVHTRAQFF